MKHWQVSVQTLNNHFCRAKSFVLALADPELSPSKQLEIATVCTFFLFVLCTVVLISWSGMLCFRLFVRTNPAASVPYERCLPCCTWFGDASLPLSSLERAGQQDVRGLPCSPPNPAKQHLSMKLQVLSLGFSLFFWVAQHSGSSRGDGGSWKSKSDTALGGAQCSLSPLFSRSLKEVKRSSLINQAGALYPRILTVP